MVMVRESARRRAPAGATQVAEAGQQDAGSTGLSGRPSEVAAALDKLAPAEAEAELAALHASHGNSFVTQVLAARQQGAVGPAGELAHSAAATSQPAGASAEAASMEALIGVMAQQQQSDSHAGTSGSAAERVKELERMIAALEAQRDALRNTIRNVQGQMAGCHDGNRMVALANQVTALFNKINKIEAELSRLRQELAAAKAESQNAVTVTPGGGAGPTTAS